MEQFLNFLSNYWPIIATIISITGGAATFILSNRDRNAKTQNTEVDSARKVLESYSVLVKDLETRIDDLREELDDIKNNYLETKLGYEAALVRINELELEVKDLRAELAKRDESLLVIKLAVAEEKIKALEAELSRCKEVIVPPDESSGAGGTDQA